MIQRIKNSVQRAEKNSTKRIQKIADFAYWLFLLYKMPVYSVYVP